MAIFHVCSICWFAGNPFSHAVDERFPTANAAALLRRRCFLDAGTDAAMSLTYSIHKYAAIESSSDAPSFLVVFHPTKLACSFRGYISSCCTSQHLSPQHLFATTTILTVLPTSPHKPATRFREPPIQDVDMSDTGVSCPQRPEFPAWPLVCSSYAARAKHFERGEPANKV